MTEMRKIFEKKGVQKLLRRYDFFNNRYLYAALYQLSILLSIFNYMIILIVVNSEKMMNDFMIKLCFGLVFGLFFLKWGLDFLIFKKIESRKIYLDSFSEIADFFDQLFITEEFEISYIKIDENVLPELATEWKKRIGLIREIKDSCTTIDTAEYETAFMNDIEFLLSVNFLTYMIPISIFVWETIPVTFPINLTKIVISLLIMGYPIYAELRKKYDEYFTFFSPQICLYKLLEDFQYMEMVEHICSLDKQLPAVIKKW